MKRTRFASCPSPPPPGRGLPSLGASVLLAVGALTACGPAPPPAPPKRHDSVALVGSAAVALGAVAVAPEGPIAVGNSNGSLTIGRVNVLALGGAFIAAFDAQGGVRWALGMGTAGTAVVHDAVRDDAGDLWFVGTFDGMVVVDGRSLRSAGGTDCFAARIDANGRPRWVERIGGPGDDACHGIALSPGGATVVGAFTDRLPLGGKTLESAGGRDGMVLQLIAKTGGVLDGWSLGGGGHDEALAVTVAAETIVVGGRFGAPVEGGAADRASRALRLGALSVMPADDADGFAAAFAMDGALRWSLPFAGPGADAIRTVSAATGGRWIIGGQQAAAGGLVIVDPGASPPGEGFAAALGPKGEMLWRYSAPGLIDVRRVAFTLTGITAVGSGLGVATAPSAPSLPATTTESAAASGAPENPAGASADASGGLPLDVVVVQLTPEGELQRRFSCGGDATDEGRALAISPQGRVYFGGIAQNGDCAAVTGSQPYGFVGWLK